jgi:hypothetical protein
MTMMPPQTPAGTATATSGVGASSAAVLLPKAGQQARISCLAQAVASVAFVAFGDVNVVATASNGVAILTGDSFVVTPPSSATHFAVFAAAAQTVYVTSGIGE